MSLILHNPAILYDGLAHIAQDGETLNSISEASGRAFSVSLTDAADGSAISAAQEFNQLRAQEQQAITEAISMAKNATNQANEDLLGVDNKFTGILGV